MVPTHRSIDAFIRSTCEHIKRDSWLPVLEIILQLVRGARKSVFLISSQATRFGNQRSHSALAFAEQGSLVVKRPRVGLSIFQSQLHHLQTVWTISKLFNYSVP